MIKILPILATVLAMTSMPIASASALTAQQVRQCKAMAASIEVRQNEVQQRVEARDALSAQVEQAGVVWDDAEAVRLFSAQQAADADTKQATYEDLKGRLLRTEAALQSDVAMINSDIAAYREMCSQ